MFCKSLLCALVAATALLGSSAVASAEDPTPFNADVQLTAKEPFEFNGIDERLNLGHSDVVNVGQDDFTVHVVVRFASLTNEGGPCLFEAGCDMSLVDKMSSPTDSIGTNKDGWRLLKQSSNLLYFCLGASGFADGCDLGSSSTLVTSQTEVKTGVWYSVTAVKTTKEISIYLNGVLEGTTALGPYSNSDAADLLVGANKAEGAFLDGQIGQVILFRKALNPGQIRALHERTNLAHQGF